MIKIELSTDELAGIIFVLRLYLSVVGPDASLSSDTSTTHFRAMTALSRRLERMVGSK